VTPEELSARTLATRDPDTELRKENEFLRSEVERLQFLLANTRDEVAALKAEKAATLPPRKKRCEACGGSGWIGCVCYDCNGTGYIEDSKSDQAS